MSETFDVAFISPIVVPYDEISLHKRWRHHCCRTFDSSCAPSKKMHFLLYFQDFLVGRATPVHF